KIDPRRVIIAANGKGGGTPFARLRDSPALASPISVIESATCLMLYTSGTTGRPKGVPRSHRSELMAAIAHIAQNQYRRGGSRARAKRLFPTQGVRRPLRTPHRSRPVAGVPRYGAPARLPVWPRE